MVYEFVNYTSAEDINLSDPSRPTEAPLMSKKCSKCKAVYPLVFFLSKNTMAKACDRCRKKMNENVGRRQVRTNAELLEGDEGEWTEIPQRLYICFQWDISIDDLLEFSRSVLKFHGRLHDKSKSGAKR